MGNEPVTYEFKATAVGTFVRHFEDDREAFEWLAGLGDGDISTEVEAASGFQIIEFVMKKVDE